MKTLAECIATAMDSSHDTAIIPRFGMWQRSRFREAGRSAQMPLLRNRWHPRLYRNSQKRIIINDNFVRHTSRAAAFSS